MEVWNRRAVYLLPEQRHRLAIPQVPLGRNSAVVLHPVELKGPLGSVG